MSDLEEPQLAELRADLETLVAQLRAALRQTRDAARPVDLDEPIGRVSRVDAIQQQQMAQANRSSARQRLAQAESALRRFGSDEYGECVACGEAVGFARLKAQPEAPLCLACQSRREGARG